MDLFVLLIAIGVAAGGMFAQEARPGVLRLALEEHVTVGAAFLRQDRGHRTAYHYCFTSPPETVCKLEDPDHLKKIAGDPNDLRIDVEIDLLAGALIANADVVFRRCQGSQGDEPQGRIDRPIGGHLHEILLAPVGRGELRLNEVDLPPSSRPWCSHKHSYG